jgi:hypothetical protein
MSVAADLADEITKKLERGRFDRDLIDTLCGGLIRLFARLERHERRLAALERRREPRPPREPVSPVHDSNGQSKRGRGRPRGSRNKPSPVHIDIEHTAHYEYDPRAVGPGA